MRILKERVACLIVILPQVDKNEVQAARLSLMQPCEELLFTDGISAGFWSWEGCVPWCLLQGGSSVCHSKMKGYWLIMNCKSFKVEE